MGALLRREGLYSSYLTVWRRERDDGELARLAPKKRGRKPQQNPLVEENARLQGSLVQCLAGSRTASDELETASRSTGSHTLTVSRRIQAFHGATEK